jgi:hypothetical protein
MPIRFSGTDRVKILVGADLAVILGHGHPVTAQRQSRVHART